MKNCLTPKNAKMSDPIQVTLLKMQPRYSQSSCENATPSSGTSPLASYNYSPPPLPGKIFPIFSLSSVNYIEHKTVLKKKILQTNKRLNYGL